MPHNADIDEVLGARRTSSRGLIVLSEQVEPRPSRRPSGSLARQSGVVRIGQHVLFAVGTFALVLAVALPTLVYPRLAILPLDPQREQLLLSADAAALVIDADAAAGASVRSGMNVTIKTFVAGARNEYVPSDQALWVIATQVISQQTGLISAQVERVSLDRHTTRTTNCCGDSVTSNLGEAPTPVTHEGLFSFPFNTQPTTYRLWDVNQLAAREARFVGESTVQGVRAYQFVQSTPLSELPVQQELPGALFGSQEGSVVATGRYRSERTTWVEPQTGAVLKMVDQLHRDYAYRGRSVVGLSGEFSTPPLSASEVAQYQAAAQVLPLLAGQASVPLAVFGVVLLLAGWGTRRLALRQV